MVGRDWTQVGVANLYTNIRKNGYHLLYLSSRAIGQANYTRDYLAKIAQDTAQLPDGPLLLSPDRLVQAFTREVIMRKPEEFKIACLRDIKNLFPRSPFYAGFGNRITDALSYRSVEIPSSRIFTVDSKGELKLELIANYSSSYIQLNDLVDQVFPITEALNEYSDFGFWTPTHASVFDTPDAPAVSMKEDYEDSLSSVDQDIYEKMEQVKAAPY